MASPGDVLLSVLCRQEIRKAIVERDGGMCIFCGKVAGHVHHIVPRSRAVPVEFLWDHRNLACVCAKCHDRAHTAEMRRLAMQILQRRFGYSYDVWPWCEVK